MAQFIPSKKTLKDFNDGERYLNKIDVVQSQTVNNLVEGLLFAQENAGSGSSSGGGMSELDKQHLDSMWNVWSSDGTTDTLVNKVEEVLSAFSSFREGDTIVGLLANKADKSALDNYVTLNTYQSITAKKSFNELLEVWDKGIMLNTDSDAPTSHIFFDRIERDWDDGIKTLYFPYKDGTLLVDSDLSNYVTLDTTQTISGGKTFTSEVDVGQFRAGNGLTKINGSSIEIGAEPNETSVVISADGISFLKYGASGSVQANTLGFQTESGIIALLDDIPKKFVSSVNGETGDVIIDQDTLGLANVAFSGSYRDLVDVPSSSGVLSVNGMTGHVVIDRKNLGLADVASTGNYNDLLNKPDLSNYVTLDTTQTISGGKTFTSEVDVGQFRAGNGLTKINGSSIEIGAEPNETSVVISADGISFLKYGASGSVQANTLGFQTESGIIALLDDIPKKFVSSVNGETGDVIIDQDTLGLANVAFSGSYRDLVDVPSSSGVLSVNGMTGHVVIDRKNLGLADVASTGNYNDLLNKPDLSNYVTLDTTQTITGAKTFGDGTGNAYTQIIMKSYSGGSPTTTYGLVVKTNTSNATYQSSQIIKNDGNQSYNYIFPNGSGTLALTSYINWSNLLNKPTFANVAFTGKYSDLIDAPSSGTTSIEIEHNKISISTEQYFHLDVPSVISQKYLYFLSIKGNLLENAAEGVIDIFTRSSSVQIVPIYFSPLWREEAATMIVLTIERINSSIVKFICNGEEIGELDIEQNSSVAECLFSGGSGGEYVDISWTVLKI